MISVTDTVTTREVTVLIDAAARAGARLPALADQQPRRAGRVRALLREHRMADAPAAAWYAGFACFAGLVAFLAGGLDATWGRSAVAGYLLAACLASLSHRTGRAGSRIPWRNLALVVALACALVAPMIWLITRAPVTPDVIVVKRSATLLLRHGSPYLPAHKLHGWRSYNPYQPGMAVFGLPHALGLLGGWGDTRLWLAASTALILIAALYIAAPHRIRRCGDCRATVSRGVAFALCSPVLAMPLTLGVTDPVVIALLGLALACAGRRQDRPGWYVTTGIAIGLACALKATAWPALAVFIALFARRDGPRVAGRFAITSALTWAGLLAVTAPSLLVRPGGLLRNTVAFPLGLTSHQTPAASPLPGHILAVAGHPGQVAALALLGAAGLAVAISLLIRPPRDAAGAAWRLAVGLTVLFTLAPASRFGYYCYPLALLTWTAMPTWVTGRPHLGGGSREPHVQPLDVPIMMRTAV